jgi:hypothetical protein
MIWSFSTDPSGFHLFANSIIYHPVNAKMPRSASEGGAGGHLLRNVFAKSTLGFSSTAKDDEGDGLRKAPDHSVKEYKRRSPSIFSHSRSTSHSSNTEMGQFAKSGLLSKRRSIARLERLRPSAHGKHHTPIWSPSSPTVTEVLYSPEESQIFTSETFYGRVLKHGEAHSSSLGWRKKSEYLVLTEHYLLRFKNLKKAAESFPSLSPQASHISRQSSSQSCLTASPVDSVPSGIESPTEPAAKSTIWLQYLIAVQLVHDNKSHSTVEIIWHNNAKANVSTLSITVDRQPGQPHWLESLSGIARASRNIKKPLPPSPMHCKIIDEAVERNSDSLNEQPAIFLVHPRHNHAGDSGVFVPDELSKDHELLRYLVIGKNKVHLIPITSSSNTSRSSSDNPFNTLSYGIVGLQRVSVNDRDDSLDLIFR